MTTDDTTAIIYCDRQIGNVKGGGGGGGGGMRTNFQQHKDRLNTRNIFDVLA